jgi:hypothetical protein
MLLSTRAGAADPLCEDVSGNFRGDSPMMAPGERQSVSKKKLLAVMRRPIFLVVINFFFVNTLFAFLPYGLGDFAYTAGRISIILYAGWLVSSRNIGGIWLASLAGTGLYFLDHVLLKGGVFLLNYLFKPQSMGMAALSSVVISFILFAPVAMAIGAAGGIIARSRKGPPR